MAGNRRTMPSDKHIRRDFDNMPIERKTAEAGQGIKSILKANRPLPNAIDVDKFVTSRAFEIYGMKRAQKQATADMTTRAFQSLPRHLRRRAASHNPRRVPKRLRDKATFEIDKGDRTVKIQRKKAEKRKREGKKGISITQKWLGRQQNKRWLETHLWHAKRAKMVTRWAYRLARTPTAKCHRPSHRAARNGCIIGDVSFYATIELEGAIQDLRGALRGVVGGSGWGGSRYESGSRMGKTMLHHHKQWPLGMIGPIDVLWQPTPVPTMTKKVWIRCHPSMFLEAWEAIRNSVSAWYDQGSSSGKGTGSSETKIIMKDLRDEICAFEMMGPRCSNVLRGVLGIAKERKTTSSSTGSSDMQVDGQESDVGRGASPKERFWNGMRFTQSSGQLGEGLVAGLTVHDPRLSFPPKNARDTHIPEGEQHPDPVFPSVELAQSQLWEHGVRENLRKPKYRKADLDFRRHELGLPGDKLQPLKEDDRVPVILIQKSLSSSTTPADQAAAVHGYTILLPAGWAMPFWQSFVFTGSRISGLDERTTQCLEAGVPAFPECYPQTRAGADWRADELKERKRRWDRRPPGKRFEYDVLGAYKPWELGWDLSMGLSDGASTTPWLAPEWLLQGIEASTRVGSTDYEAIFWRVLDKCQAALGLSLCPLADRESVWDSALVHATVTIVGRGSPKDFGEIYPIGLDETERLLGDANIGEKQAPKPDPSQSRLGHVLSGTQSLARGRGHGIAAISLRRFLLIPTVLQKTGKTACSGRLVKVRNPEGVIWRYAFVHVVKS